MYIFRSLHMTTSFSQLGFVREHNERCIVLFFVKQDEWSDSCGTIGRTLRVTLFLCTVFLNAYTRTLSQTRRRLFVRFFEIGKTTFK